MATWSNTSVVPRPVPTGDLTQRVQLGIGCGVRVLHRHVAAELDVLADGCPERLIGRHPGLVQGGHIQLDEALALLLGDVQAAMDGDEMVEAELLREAVGAARALR